MNKKYNLLGIFLAAVTGSSLLIAMMLRAFLPAFILPKLNSITLIILSLIALILDYYLSKEKHRVYWLMPLYGALIFGIFPWVSCFVDVLSAVKIGVLGAVIFTVVTYLFDSMTNRLSSTPASRVAPIISAFGLYLASQCLMGII